MCGCGGVQYNNFTTHNSLHNFIQRNLNVVHGGQGGVASFAAAYIMMWRRRTVPGYVRGGGGGGEESKSEILRTFN